MKDLKVTKANANRTLGEIRKQGSNLFGKVQAYLMYALDQYALTGNPAALTNIAHTIEDLPRIDAKHLIGYVKDHANVKYSHAQNAKKDDRKVFSKIKKGDKPEITVPLVTWENYENKKSGTGKKAAPKNPLVKIVSGINPDVRGRENVENALKQIASVSQVNEERAVALVLRKMMSRKDFDNAVKKELAAMGCINRQETK